MGKNGKYIEEVEIDHEDFRELEDADRHEQLISALNKFATALNNSNDKEITKAIGENNFQIGNFVKELSNLKISVPNVNLNQSEVVSAITFAVKKITDGQTATNNLLQTMLDNRITEWKFTILKRDNIGRIEEVLAKAIK